MAYGELLGSLLINLQSVFKNNINVESMSFQKIIALLIIPTDGIEMSSLSIKLGVDNSTITRLIIGMEKIGLVERKISYEDKRVYRVFLTSQGITTQKEVESQVDFIGNDLKEIIKTSDIQNLIENLEELNWALLKMGLNKK